MKNFSYLFIFILPIILTQCTSSGGKQEAQPSVEKEEVSELGNISIEVSGSAEARPYFIEGLLLMHSFEYEDAAEKFIAAQEIDTTFAMAYWGEAMTKNHPLWRAQFTEEAQAILMELAPTKEERMALAKTAFEKDMLEGAEILFGEGVKEDRDVLYQNHMETLYQKYPGNHEVAALYALSVLGGVKEGRDYEAYGKAATIAQSIIAENANHPGALHYTIHAYDDPGHAFKALEAANRYSKVAPDATHALHMPSHIYIALGMWDEVISTNIVSYNASVERMKNKGLDNDARGYHAYKWLMYACMQKGEYEQARTYVDSMKQYCYEKPSPRARSHFIQMRALYLSETDGWNNPLASDTVSFDDLNLSIQAIQRFVDGSIAYQQKDKKALTTVIEKLSTAIEEARNTALAKGGAMCSGVSGYNQTASKLDINKSQVMLHELTAFQALLDNNENQAIASMKAAVDLEEATSFSFGPPEIIKPAPELYGEFLLTKGDKSSAKLMFEKVLERAPKRMISTRALEKTS
jgi:tetratricopeptide (TPR) repeat protein